MRVSELAGDLKVPPDLLLRFLREVGVAANSRNARLRPDEVSRAYARVERERRGGKTALAAIRSCVQSKGPVGRRIRARRRRRTGPSGARPQAANGDAQASSDSPVLEAEAPSVSAGATSAAPGAESAAVDQPSAVAPAGAAKDPLKEAAPPAESGEAPSQAEPTSPDPISAAPGGPERPVAPKTGSRGAEELRSAAADSTPPSLATRRTQPPGGAPGRDAPAPAGRPAGGPTPVQPTPVRASSPAHAAKTPPQAASSGLRSAREGLGGLRSIRRPPADPIASGRPAGTVRIQAEGYTSDGRRKRRRKGRRRRGGDAGAAIENVQRVLAELKGPKKRSRPGKSSIQAAKEEVERKREEERQARDQEAKTVRVTEFLTVTELADLIDQGPREIVQSAFRNLSMMVSMNQRLDFDQIDLLLEEFGYRAQRETSYESAPSIVEEDRPEDREPRPPVVTVMGHVDHGKTRLLDRIRNTNVIEGEAGGITQHIGAYHVDLDDGRSISFLDTPGHAAFTAMRARGADVTDIVILVVAADDSVMPQTREAISHAKTANVPIVVAINKVDLPAADPMRVKQDLLGVEGGITVEDFGGDALVAEVSAKTGRGIDDLLEKVVLQADLLELTANPTIAASATVVEAELDRGKGPLATVLVGKGTLKVGDSFVVGKFPGKVKALLDERGRHVKSARPGFPVQVLGAKGVPQAGDGLQVMEPQQALQVARERDRLDREKDHRVRASTSKLGDFTQVLEGGSKELNIIVKGDVDGSVQAVSDALSALSTSEVRVNIVHRATGSISENDIMLAKSVGAIVVGFNTRPMPQARRLAAVEQVSCFTYTVIYEAVQDIRASLEGMLSPEEKEHVLGVAEVKEVFKIRGVGTIAGSFVSDGRMTMGQDARIVRQDKTIYRSRISSLRRFKDDVAQVRNGLECGIGVENFNDVKVGDLIEVYEVVETARTLEMALEAS